MTLRIRANWISFIVLLLIVGNTYTYAQPAIFGTTYEGGEYGQGTIFRTDANGDNIDIVFGPVAVGAGPSGKLLEVSNGIYYGLAAESGPKGSGVLFEYNMTSGEYSEKHAFDGDDGYGPLGSLIKASNGKLYGLTESGGINGDGVIFEYDYVNNIYTKKIDLEFATLGNQPATSFLEASNGKLYGLVANGGVSASGAIIEYDPLTNVAVRKADFINAVNGRIPYGRLIEHNGKLYGTTTAGGPNDGGTLFEYDLVTTALNTVIDFNVAASSRSTPMIASNGKMYGVTAFSGTSSAGEIYEYDFTTSTVSYVVQFSDYGIKRGLGELIENSPGKLLGKCEGGGANTFGGIFEYDFNTSTLVVKASFETGSAGGYESFIVGSDGNLYGLNPYGGTAFTGLLYRFNPSTSALSNLYNFGIVEEGTNPASLVLSSNGKLYGVNNKGGIYGGGTLFEMDPLTYEINPLVHFKPLVFASARVSQVANNYSSPHFLMEASNGKLYGRTNRGGAGYGVIFEYDPATDALTKKVEFDGNTGYNGGGIQGGLLEVNGKLYGVTRVGGPSGSGSLFEYDISSSSITVVADFDPEGISEVTSNLALASNGKLYGTSTVGGLSNKGTIFEYDITSETITKKIDFASVSGFNSYGGLLAVANDQLLGVTYSGGTNNKGEIFEYTPSTNNYTTLASFDATGLVNPVGEMFAAANGKFYGLTGGSLFEFNATSNIIAEKHDFASSAGSRFYPSSLFEICTQPLFDETNDIRQCANSSFSITVTSPNTDSYLWKRDGVVLSGQTSNSITVADAKLDNAGEYTCELTNACGTVIVSTMVVIDELSITTSFDGTEVSVAVTGGTSPYTYSSNGTDFQSGANFLLANGQYTITVRDANSCEASTSQALVITALEKGLEDQQNIIYPNPVSSVLHLNGAAKNSMMRLRDMAGRLVIQESIVADHQQVQVGFLQPGVYLVETTGVDGKARRTRVMKK